MLSVMHMTLTWRVTLMLSSPSSNGSQGSWMLMEVILLFWYSPGMRRLMISAAKREVQEACQHAQIPQVNK